MTVWGIVKCFCGVGCILMGIFKGEFTPLGWTTSIIWGSDENARIPRWLAAPFYVGLGVLMVYWGVTGK